MAPVGPARPLAAGRAEAWAVLSPRGGAHAREPREAVADAAAACSSTGVLGPRRRFCAGHNGRFLKTCFGNCSQHFVKRQPKKHIRDAAVVIEALETVSQPSAPQQARETARAAARAFTSGQFGKTQFGQKKRPDRRASALFPQEAAAQPRVALRNQNSARRPPGKSNTVRQLRAGTLAAASTPSNRGNTARTPCCRTTHQQAPTTPLW